MMRMNRIFVIVGILLLALVGVVLFSTTYGPKTDSGAVGIVTVSDEIPVYGYKILKTYPHDPKAFTQGLVYYKDDILYEGTGMWGESSLRKVDLKTGQVLQIHTLPGDIFGEGITLWGDKIIQLTWQHRKGFVYDRETFTLLREFSYPTEGWGITHDGTRLIMSDGSATLFVWDPETFQEIGRIEVRDDKGPVVRLNELEYIRGLIYANVWQTDRIAIIRPDDGRVVGWIDLSGLLAPEDRHARVDVLNGIAYDAEGDRLFVTGKYWPKLFQIQLIKK
jgi:glutamine cyclotransferase